MTPAQYLSSMYNFSQADTDGRKIASILYDLKLSGSWLDLGSGPMLPVWSVFSNGFTEIVGSDLLIENVDFLNDQRNKGILAEPHVNAEKYLYEISQRNTDSLFKLAFARLSRSIQLDVRVLQRDLVGNFDFVSQIGCFGCLATDSEFSKAIENAQKYLKPGGLFLSVTWTQLEFNNDNKWNGEISENLSASSIIENIESTGMGIEKSEVEQSCDPHWDKQIIILSKKPI